MSSQRWDRRRPRTPTWLVGVIVVAAIVLGVRYLAISAEPASPALASLTHRSNWQRQVLRSPPPQPVRIALAPIKRKAESPVDRLWSRTNAARARGDTQGVLTGLRTIAEDHPEDSRTPTAAFMLASIAPAAEERCLALAMVVGLSPASEIGVNARERLPSACVRPL